ncbi:unnamed protein product [Protopolystoma xenopodis]|uniref:MBD domain-containing protein n=1 Tax=Protopolystoma xenopodis TaxID=117903 RepID=A0A448XI82_9PLAT|nr:unnamed protein product [Protopolystoma xenopodis]
MINPHVSSKYVAGQKRFSQSTNISKPVTTTSVPAPNNNSILSQQPPVLPQGWRKEEFMRPNGLSTGKTEIYYISPNGAKIRTKQGLQAALGDKYDISLFDWRTGRFITPSQKLKRNDLPDCGPPSKCPKIDGFSNTLTRRSPYPIATQPNLIVSQPCSKRSDIIRGPQDLAHQLFWEKRLSKHHAVDPETGEVFKPLNLPKGIQSAGVPGYDSDQLVQSIINAVTTRSTPVTGQEQQPSAIEKNPCVVINHLQPMIKTYIVTDDDIRRQEARVKELRRKLEMARKKLFPASY